MEHCETIFTKKFFNIPQSPIFAAAFEKTFFGGTFFLKKTGHWTNFNLLKPLSLLVPNGSVAQLDRASDYGSEG